MITSDKVEAERRYPNELREDGWEILRHTERAAYIAGREDERAAKFMTADYYVAADTIADLRHQLEAAEHWNHLRAEDIRTLGHEVGAAERALADLRRQLDEARVVAKSERERIAALLDEIGATWAAGCVRTMPPPGERVP